MNHKQDERYICEEDMTGNQQKIIEFLTDCKLETLPASTVHEAKRALLDTLGCMIAGLDTPLGRKLVRLSGRFTDSRGATVLGGRKQVMHLFAAMCNGFMANAHDADDGHRMSRLHAGGIIIPTVLAAAEEKDCDGGKLIEAIVIGYELGLRAGMASTDGDIYYGSAYGSTFGAAAAAGWILGLYNKQIVNAMGISEMYAPNYISLALFLNSNFCILPVEVVGNSQNMIFLGLLNPAIFFLQKSINSASVVFS
jgi:2-methylcitrate dehydratase PrpD